MSETPYVPPEPPPPPPLPDAELLRSDGTQAVWFFIDVEGPMLRFEKPTGELIKFQLLQPGSVEATKQFYRGDQPLSTAPAKQQSPTLPPSLPPAPAPVEQVPPLPQTSAPSEPFAAQPPATEPPPPTASAHASDYFWKGLQAASDATNNVLDAANTAARYNPISPFGVNPRLARALETSVLGYPITASPDEADEPIDAPWHQRLDHQLSNLNARAAAGIPQAFSLGLIRPQGTTPYAPGSGEIHPAAPIIGGANIEKAAVESLGMLPLTIAAAPSVEAAVATRLGVGTIATNAVGSAVMGVVEAAPFLEGNTNRERAQELLLSALVEGSLAGVIDGLGRSGTALHDYATFDFDVDGIRLGDSSLNKLVDAAPEAIEISAAASRPTINYRKNRFDRMLQIGPTLEREIGEVYLLASWAGLDLDRYSIRIERRAGYFKPGENATYTRVAVTSENVRVSWDMITNKDGRVPIALNPAILDSDEAIVGALLHEDSETRALELIMDSKQNREIPWSEFQNYTWDEGSLHTRAWQESDDAVRKLFYSGE